MLLVFWVSFHFIFNFSIFGI